MIFYRKFIFIWRKNFTNFIHFAISLIRQENATKLALALAEKILHGFKTYMGFFKTYTQLASIHFRERDWLGTKSNQLQQLRLCKDVLIPLAEECRDILQEHATETSSWALIKNRYSTLIKEMYYFELAENFFNSVIRKILPKTLINEEFIFVMEGFNSCAIPENSDLLQTYPRLGRGADYSQNLGRL